MVPTVGEAHRERLEDLVLDPARHPERRHAHRRAGEVLARIVDEAGHLDAISLAQREDLGGRLGSHDREARIGDGAAHSGQDLVGEPAAPVHVGVVVHHADEDEVPRLCTVGAARGG